MTSGGSACGFMALNRLLPLGRQMYLGTGVLLFSTLNVTRADAAAAAGFDY